VGEERRDMIHIAFYLEYTAPELCVGFVDFIFQLRISMGKNAQCEIWASGLQM
jgi:hypothetical protein